jgi:hypothetical protein
LQYWLVIHNLVAYNQHNDLIGCMAKKKDARLPKFPKFAQIHKGDQIVYYAIGDKVVIGIFNVVSEMQHLEDDTYWRGFFVYKIHPLHMPPEGHYLNFKRFVADKNIKLDLFPKKQIWARYLQGRTCRRLTSHDFEIIKTHLNDRGFLKLSSISDSAGANIRE